MDTKRLQPSELCWRLKSRSVPSSEARRTREAAFDIEESCARHAGVFTGGHSESEGHFGDYGKLGIQQRFFDVVHAWKVIEVAELEGRALETRVQAFSRSASTLHG